MGEWDKNIGVPTVTSFHTPCPYCHACKRDMYNKFTSCSLASIPWAEKHDAFHQEQCSLREIRIEVTSEHTRKLILETGRPFYPKGKKGRGRALSRPIAALGLRAGDRIEHGFDLADPGSLLLDPANLEHKPLPFTCIFWRQRMDSRGRLLDAVSRRNPIFSVAHLGTSVSRTLALDSLHLVYLGVCGRLVSTILWRLVLENPFGCQGDADVIVDQECFGGFENGREIETWPWSNSEELVETLRQLWALEPRASLSIPPTPRSLTMPLSSS